MSMIKVAFIAAFAAVASLSMSGAGEFGQAEAKAHAKPGKPGKCGVNYYYDKKQKMCLNAMLK